MIRFDLRDIGRTDEKPLGPAFRGVSASGRTVEVTSRSLRMDGKPFFGVSGEVHYCRVSPDQWEDTVLKAKVGGVNILSTYVFWITHEEREGVLRFDGCRDLRRFLEVCKKHGMLVILRIGPFNHGEMRNGGLPDWLYGKPFDVRENDPAYLSCVRRFFAAVHAQTDGLYFSQDGPVIAVQLENEYMHSSAPWEVTTGISGEWVNGGSGGEEHIRALKRIAREAGIIAPFYTCTAWGGAMAPADEVLPLWGGYSYQPWIFYNKTGEHPRTPEYIYRDNHNSLVRETYNFKPRHDPASVPYACCEMMGGMMCSYNYRFILPFESVDAMANIKLGSGAAMLGYYMYRGGTTPTGECTPYLNESQISKRSYDYQAAIGEFGQLRPSYFRLRTLHDFLSCWGEELLEGVTVNQPSEPSPEDGSLLRCCVRGTEKSGFLFVNNFQDHMELPAKGRERVELCLKGETLSFSVSLAGGENAVLPYNLRVGTALLKTASVQPVARFVTDGTPYCFFMIPAGAEAEMVFDASTVDSLTGIDFERNEKTLTVRPVTDSLTDFELNGVRVTVMTRDTAMRFSHFTVSGRELAVLAEGAVCPDGDALLLETGEQPRMLLCCPPGVTGIPEKERYGVFAGGTLPGVSESFIPGVEKSGASRWRVFIDPSRLQGHKHVLLRVNYFGDIGHAFIGNEMISDNFCNGAPWEIRLDPWAEQLRNGPLVIYITPLRKGITVDVSSAMAGRMARAESSRAELDTLSVICTDEIRIPLRSRSGK